MTLDIQPFENHDKPSLITGATETDFATNCKRCIIQFNLAFHFTQVELLSHVVIRFSFCNTELSNVNS